ncbi:MAG TPA: helicase-related protein, partial [Longimicrobiales bacterium]|nr:helicase-related protein [Longimicrobiales bacterium]
TRLDAERRLKEGSLRALVATASLELGIDVGHVDLVCQLGSPHRISAFLQRVGRSGHTVAGTPKGRLIPLSRDDLIECAALLRAARSGELDRLRIPEKPYDILVQQMVAASACREWTEDELYALVRRAWPYRGLERREFDELLRMASRGFDTRRGRRGALLHHDPVNGRIRGRKGARLYAITCGGAIPDNADYRVVLEPEGTYLGTLNEDFAVESLPGDIVQLGNASWRILRIETGVVRVEDARGEPPNIPFWLGEAPSRSEELSRAVAGLRDDMARALDEGGVEGAVDALASEPGIGRSAARQIVEYLAEAKRLLGAVPTRDTLVLERFFDEAGGMQLVLHAPFGARVNRAWGLALRKRFCRQFNFELQAAATEEGILLSLGPQHSFPLDDVFRFLHPDSVEEVLVQAVLDAPMFQTRWRWNATLSLALPRWRGGSRTPPQIQRMEAEDLLSAVFPDATACLEHIAGDRDVPDHPLVRQTLRDCLTEVMDLPGLLAALDRVRGGELELVARDLPEPSPLSHELLTARPFAYLYDAPLEGRRARALYARRALEPSAARELGALDPDAIAAVRKEARPDAADPDEAHDGLLVSGFLTGAELVDREDGEEWRAWLDTLAADGRAARVRVGDRILWTSAERLPELVAVHPRAAVEPEITPPEEHASEPGSRDEAVRELLRSRIEMAGPVTAARLAGLLGVGTAEAHRALVALEGEGAVLRGTFTAAAGRTRDGAREARHGEEGDREEEWCERRLLARIHRRTLDRLRAEIRPASAADYMRFLLRWQRVEPGHRVAGREGLLSVLELLDGFELPAGAWEVDVLAARCAEYDPDLLDELCQTGSIAWGRLSPPEGGGESFRSTGPLRSSPIALFLRESEGLWLERREAPSREGLSGEARTVLGVLDERGASFFHELVSGTGLLPTRVEGALGELAAFGLVTSDRFAGLRALLTPSDRRKPLGDDANRGGRRRKRSPWGVDTAGRWSLLGVPNREPASADGGGSPRSRGGPGGRRGEARDGARSSPTPSREAEIEALARAYLLRWGVVFRKVLAREPLSPPWRDLVRALRRMEARGEVRGGRFVAGFSGEQFALPEAVTELRKVRKEPPAGELVAVSAADPLNLTGIVTPGERVPAIMGTRIGLRDGVPVRVLEGDELRTLGSGDGEGPDHEIRRTLVRREIPPSLRGYVRPAG